MTVSFLRRGVTKAGFAAAVIALGLSVFTASAAFAGTVGTATIELPNTTPLNGTQGSAQQFTLALGPNTPICSGNSVNNGFLVQSYLVPSTTSPSTLTYTAGNINGAGNFSLFDSASNQFGPANTSSTGQVIGIPLNLEFGATFPASIVVPSGTSAVWNAGVACANSSGAVTDYWNIVCTFTLAQADPNGYTFACVNPVGSVLPESPLAIGLPIGGAAVLASGVFINRRRRSRRAYTTAAA